MSKVEQMKKIIGDNTNRYWAVFGMAAEFLALQLAPTTYQPDAIIAGLPIYHMQHEGHAASDEMLKYRSMGTIFLAHQKGGKRTFKCTLLIQGPARLYVLMFLQFLQKAGIQENITLSDFANKVGMELPQGPETEPFISPTTNDKIRYMQGYELESEMMSWHKTFPIITETKIYTNMYLETLRYTEDIKIGAETIQIDLAFREFIPPLHVKWYGDEEKEERAYFTTWLSNDERDALRRLDLTINILWHLRPFLQDMFDPSIQQKQIGQYNIEGSILLMGLTLSKMSIWSK